MAAHAFTLFPDLPIPVLVIIVTVTAGVMALLVPARARPLGLLLVLAGTGAIVMHHTGAAWACFAAGGVSLLLGPRGRETEGD